MCWDMADNHDIKLILSKEDYDRLVSCCIAQLPNEACGLLAGEIYESVDLKSGKRLIKHIKQIYPLSNTDESSTHFSINPREQLEAVRDARAKGYEIIGNFHSHPHTPARPSAEDRRMAYDVKLEYCILSLMNPNAPVFGAFGIDESKAVTSHETEILKNNI